jgi:DNA-binding transcriptional ArsR family regulator
MNPTSTFHPTLWRTCRVIANHTRLRIFSQLSRHPNLTVSAVAKAVDLPVPTTSQYLRAMEARGLLEVRRDGRNVRYRLAMTDPAHPAHGLVKAISLVFKRKPEASAALFRAATAFTHPRRIEIYRAVKRSPKTLSQIIAASKIPAWASLRHLHKLEERGFVSSLSGYYLAAKQTDDFGIELTQLIANQ